MLPGFSVEHYHLHFEESSSEAQNSAISCVVIGRIASSTSELSVPVIFLWKNYEH